MHLKRTVLLSVLAPGLSAAGAVATVPDAHAATLDLRRAQLPQWRLSEGSYAYTASYSNDSGTVTAQTTVTLTAQS